MIISFKHFCEEIIGSADRDLGLNEDSHSLHDVFSAEVVEGHFSFNIIINLQSSCALSDNTWLSMSHTQMLGERNLPELFDKFLGLKSIVKVLTNFVESGFHLLNIVNSSLPKLFEFQVCKLLLGHLGIIFILLVVGCDFLVTII